MITNGTASPENYYVVKFANVPYELYAYGETAIQAVSNAFDDMLDEGREPLGASIVRRAVYKEWNYGTEHFTIGGNFIADTRKPCIECGEPVAFHTHKEEMGFCLACQHAYFDEGGNE